MPRPSVITLSRSLTLITSSYHNITSDNMTYAVQLAATIMNDQILQTKYQLIYNRNASKFATGKKLHHWTATPTILSCHYYFTLFSSCNNNNFIFHMCKCIAGSEAFVTFGSNSITFSKNVTNNIINFFSI